MTRLLSTHKGKITPAERVANAEKYVRDTAEDRAADLLEARSALVRAYRASPGKWPDGIDTKYDRWYRAAEWKDDGTFVGAKP